MKTAVGRYGGLAVKGVALAGFLLSALPPYRLTAQSNPVVRAAVELAAEGRGDSAYKLVNGQLTRATPGDSAYVEALYWRGRLATWGDSAERDLRRVAIEYGSSAWADDALLQLSQLALAAGNPASAYELAGRVRSDYPDSDLKPRAALWAARAAFEVGEPRSACALLDTARTEGAGDIEFVNQVQFYRSRCTASVLAAPRRTDSVATPRSDSAPVATTATAAAVVPPAPLPPPAPAVALRGFEVQVAASASDSAAQAVLERLSRAGLHARIVAGEGTTRRVRLGPYPTQAAADSVARRAQRAIGGQPFVVRVP